MFYVASSSLLAVVETDEGWAVLFDDGKIVPNMTKECAGEIIGYMNMAKTTPATLGWKQETHLREASP